MYKKTYLHPMTEMLKHQSKVFAYPKFQNNTLCTYSMYVHYYVQYVYHIKVKEGALVSSIKPK
jgi:hypothetical protein